MADAVCRVLRDGALEGEHATSLIITDSVDSPFGPIVFDYIFTQLSSFISSRKSQSRGIVLVTFSRSPSVTVELLKNRGNDIDTSHKWLEFDHHFMLRVLDCYTDPLGWKERLKEHGAIKTPSTEALPYVSLCKDVRNLNDMFSSIIALGKGLVGGGKNQFSVAIDSLSEMLRHTSVKSATRLLSNLRSHAQVSSVFWLLHSDLHDIKTVAAFEHMIPMVAEVKPLTAETTNALKDNNNNNNLSLLEQNHKKGQFKASLTRRNGRIRELYEGFSVEQSFIKFTTMSTVEIQVAQSLVPMVQFNLQLSEKERNDRAKVVLPFEHQETGKSVQIYDGRKSLNEDKHESNGVKLQKKEDSSRGEIIYFRDSDDEMADSDEDPDDDLDI